MARETVPRLEEAARLDGRLRRVLERGERDRAALAQRAGLRVVREHAEEPRLQRRAALEAPDPREDAEERVLHDLLGHGPAGDVHLSHAQERGAELVDELGDEVAHLALAERPVVEREP